MSTASGTTPTSVPPMSDPAIDPAAMVSTNRRCAASTAKLESWL
jgi:hypothetical protein